MPRLAIGLEYDGTGFCGWQRQPRAASLQAVVESAVSAVADEPVTLTIAGRTDAGVHATGQVAHFDTGATRPIRAWLLGVNSNLPPQVNITWVRAVPHDFSARYSALWRRYRYVILNRPVRSALWHNRAMWVHGDLDVETMQAATPPLLGEHDFSAFRALECQARSPVRTLHELSVRRAGAFVVIEGCANAWLHHMVRNLVGSLLRIGRREAPPEWLATVLGARDRRVAGMTAPAAGLYLAAVGYPPRLGLPPAQPCPPGDL